MQLTIIRAQPEHAARLTEIAVAAKSYWGYPEHWIRQWRAQLTITPDYVRDHEVYAIANGDMLVGFYALKGEGSRLRLDHLWVQPEYIGTGVGRILFTHALQRAAARSAEEIEIHADPHAAGFYRHMGAQQIGEVDATIDDVERHLPIFVIRVLVT